MQKKGQLLRWKKICIMKSLTETSWYFLLLPLVKGILGKSLGLVAHTSGLEGVRTHQPPADCSCVSIYLFIWPLWVLVAACGVSCLVGACGIAGSLLAACGFYLVPWPGIKPRTSCFGSSWSLSLWTTREVPPLIFFFFFFFWCMKVSWNQTRLIHKCSFSRAVFMGSSRCE